MELFTEEQGKVSLFSLDPYVTLGGSAALDGWTAKYNLALPRLSGRPTFSSTRLRTSSILVSVTLMK